ncbi:hypothetical protein [Flavobacterium notoginsengisoli]|uniref:hypothetical protein n=1 Tax=Flavobacterium notoginsengisoli TaxID=1478199 RepID=UPI00362FDCE1
MAQFEFYINDNDRIKLVNFILSKRTNIIPDLLYESKKYRILEDTEDFNNCMKNRDIRYFLLDSSYASEDLNFLEVLIENKTKYKISQRVGGPYLDLVFYLGHAEDSTIPYKRSELDFYSKFIHLNSTDEFKASVELKAYYSQIVKFIKSQCRSVKKNGKNYWISNEVLQEISIDLD